MSDGPASEALLLDEMFSPALAEFLRKEGIDAVSVAGHPVLAAAPDVEMATWAARHDRRVLTENVRDFVPLVGIVEPPVRLLLTSSRRFPRSRRNPEPLRQALRAWVTADVERASVEWLR